MLRIVIVPLIVFAGIGAALVALILFATPEQSLLTQQTVDSVMNAPSTPLDSLIVDDQAGNATPGADPKDAELRRRQQRIEGALLVSIGYAMALGVVLAIAWGFHARDLAASAAGPRSQRRGLPSWIGLMAIYAAAFVACYAVLVRDPLTDPNPGPYAIRLGGIIVSGLIGYWLATALAVSVTMRPSVPLASMLTTARERA